MGVSPWNRNPHHAVSPKGTTGNPTRPTHVASSRLCGCVGPLNHGFAPVATAYRPFGTNVLALGRYVGAEAVEDDHPLLEYQLEKVGRG